MRTLLALITVSTLAGACAPGRIPQTQDGHSNSRVTNPFELGVNIHLDSGAQLLKACELGVQWVRVDVNWDGVEPRAGEWDFSAPDRSILDARNLGLKVYATLAYSPPWASSTGKGTGVPDIRAWERFVDQAARHYRGMVQAYGIWNEPNLEEFWTGSAEQYVDVLLKPAFRAIRLNDPSALVAGPDLAHLYSARLGIQDFLRTLAERGGADCLDVLSHHVYGADDFPHKLFGFSFGSYLYKPGLVQMLQAAGLDHKPVWITEMGAEAGALGEKVQAELIVRQLGLLKSQHWVNKVFIYQLRDDRVEGPQWGLCRTDSSPRPAYGQVREFSLKHLNLAGTAGIQ